MAETPSILKALNLLGRTGSEKENTTTPVIALPTATSRAALTKMAGGIPADYQDVNLRNLLQDILNWNGENKVNKPLIRAYGDVLAQPYLYPQLVEFTGYMAAIAPMLEADHLARLVETLPETKTAFAPTLYTLNFHKNLSRAFADLSPQRIEKIAASLWLESHKGRWWNMTAGVDNVQQNQGSIKPETLLKSLKTYRENGSMENIIWSPENQAAFSKYIEKKLDKDLALVSEKFRLDLMAGEAITPDIAIFLSATPWLAPSQRPESPINSLARTLAAIREDPDTNFHMPKKPNSIKELYPNLMLAGSQKMQYPFDPNILDLFTTKRLITNCDEKITEFNLIVNHAQLANNAQHMGNCTLTYENNMKKGEYALFYIKTGDKEYNLSVTLTKANNKWRVGELNTRYNGGQVSDNLRRSVTRAIEQLPPVSEEYRKLVENFQEDKNGVIIYSYTL